MKILRLYPRKYSNTAKTQTACTKERTLRLEDYFLYLKDFLRLKASKTEALSSEVIKGKNTFFPGSVNAKNPEPIREFLANAKNSFV
jgi:hypothetical protein